MADVITTDQSSMIHEWEPYIYHQHTKIFEEVTDPLVYGFLGFAVTRDACNDLFEYYSQTVESDPDLFSMTMQFLVHILLNQIYMQLLSEFLLLKDKKEVKLNQVNLVLLESFKSHLIARDYLVNQTIFICFTGRKLYTTQNSKNIDLSAMLFLTNVQVVNGSRHYVATCTPINNMMALTITSFHCQSSFITQK